MTSKIVQNENKNQNLPANNQALEDNCCDYNGG